MFTYIHFNPQIRSGISKFQDLMYMTVPNQFCFSKMIIYNKDSICFTRISPSRTVVDCASLLCEVSTAVSSVSTVSFIASC